MKILRIRWLLVALAALLTTGVAAAAPIALREVGSFRVQHVDVRGVRHLAPETVLRASGITAASTVFDRFDPWRASLLQHPLVAAVEIERKLPSTIVVHVRETDPVAFARTPELAPVDGRGRLLPIDPLHAELDLPVIGAVSKPTANGRFADRETVQLAEVVATVRSAEPSLLPWISEVHMEGTAVRMVLRSPAGAEVFMALPLGADRLRELRLTMADLAARQELPRLARLDARFRDQIVVTFGNERKVNADYIRDTI